MTGSLLPEIFLRAIDANGLAINGAKLYAYLTTTTTPTNTYTSSTLGVANANPVVADSGGLFGPIFLDPAVTYRFQLKTNAGVLIEDLDPFSPGANIAAASITTAMLQAGVAVANLGFTPLSRSGDTATGEIILGYALGGPPGDKSVGFRNMPMVEKEVDYTFVGDDSGKLYRTADGSNHAWTIPPHSSVAFVNGTVIGFRSCGAGVITLTRGAGVALRIGGSATSQNIAVAAFGCGALVCEDGSANLWYALGTGLS